MNKHFTLIAISISVGLITGCASWNQVKESVFKNSALSNPHPAPASMSPPQTSEADVLDPVYLRTQADYHYSLAEALSLEGQSEKAIEEFKLAQIYDAESPELKVRLAIEYIKSGLLSEAIEQAEGALQQDPNAREPRLILANLYSSLKMYSQAKDHYKHLIQVFPEDVEVWFYMAALEAEEGNFGVAEKYFLKATTIKNTENQGPYLAHYYLGKLYVGQGDKYYQKAIKSFKNALFLKPKFDDAALALAGVYELIGEEKNLLEFLETYQDKNGPKKAVALYLSQFYLAKDPGNDETLKVKYYKKALVQLKYLEGFESDNLSVMMKLALIYIELKSFDQAIAKLESVLSISPESDKIRFYLGAVYEEMKKPGLAISHFEKIESTSSYFAEAVIHKAFLLKELDDIPQALEHLELAIKQRDDIPQFYAYYASLLDERREYQRAVVRLEEAVSKFPTHSQLNFFLGSMLDRTGQTARSITQFKKVLELDANHVQALNYLAYTYAELNSNLEEAQALALRALELKPKDAFVMDTVGWIHFKQGQTEIAIKYLEAAHSIRPTESIVAEHLGDAYYKHQLVEKAKAMYNKALLAERDTIKHGRIQQKITAIEKIQPTNRLPASEANN